MRSLLAMLRSHARRHLLPGTLLALMNLISLARSGPALAAGPGQWTPWVDWAAGNLEKYAVAATRGQRAAESAALPLRFALHPNQPNPFAARTTIRFDLPVGAMVRLEVYDVMRRCVRVLANHYFPPGYQAVEWDGRTGAGHSAGPGVYYYRIEAGPWRERKTMVLLP